MSLQNSIANHSYTRRLLLAGTAAAASGALLGCAGTSNSKKVAAASCVNSLDINVKAAPDIPGAIISDQEGVPLAWKTYPKPYKTVTEPPGHGGTVTTFQILFSPPPTAFDKNPWWQELNKRLGVTIQPNLAPSDSYPAKLNTLAASGKFPDIVYINFAGGAGSNAFEKTVSQGAFHDLTKYLTGNGIEEFPNLNLFPEWAWKGTAFEGRLFGVPRPVQPVNGSTNLYRQDWAEAAGVDNPTNADEVFKLMTNITKGAKNSKNSWAISGFGGGLWAAMYGVPNAWRLDDSGKLVHQIETEEYASAVNFAARLWKTGAMYPESATVTFQQSLDLFNSGRVAFFAQGFNPLMGMMGKQSDLHKADPHAKVTPFALPGHDGGDPVLPMGSGIYGFCAIPSSIKDEARIKELLGILNYYAAPYGSEEYTFMQYGMEGRHFKFDNKGIPTSLDDPKVANEMTLNYMCETGEINFFYPTDPGLAKIAQDTEAAAMKVAEADPTMGLYSPTQVSKGAALDQLGTDYYNGIVTGRKKMSDLDEWRSQWKSRGGEKMRAEFSQAIEKCKK